MRRPLRCNVLCLVLAACATMGSGGDATAQNKKQPPANSPPLNPPPPVLLQPPKTAEEYFRAALLMHQLARPNLARSYLESLLKLPLDDAALLKLHDKFGPSDFLRLARAKELQPLSQDLLGRVNAAVRRRSSNPQYIDTLLDQLEGDPADREAALVMLKNIGPVVLPRLLDRAGKAKTATQLGTLQTALTEFGPPAVPLLLAALDAPGTRIRTVALTALGYIGETSSAAYLWHLAFDPNQPPGVRTAAREALARIHKTSVEAVDRRAPASVSRELQRLALVHFRGEVQWPLDGDQKVEFWYWDAKAGVLKTTRVSPRFASLFVGTRFARQALELSAENRQTQALFVAMSLSAAADPTWQRALPAGKGTAFEGALLAGSGVVHEALRLSLRHGDADAAIGCLLVLRQLAKRSDLRNEAGRPPIVQALRSPDQRVRFMAAVAVLNIDPQRSFRGISRVVPILAGALSEGGSPTSLVVHANVQQASAVGGLLGELGYQSQVATSGRAAFRRATSRRDIELILLHVNTIRWPLSQTLANLRADARTAGIPIAIYGPEELRSRMRRHVTRYRMVTYVVESTTGDHLAMQLRPFLGSLKTPPLSAKQRAEQRRSAAFWLARIASGNRADLYDLSAAEGPLVDSLNDPDIAENAIQALAAIPSKTAQQALHGALINPNLKPTIRVLAAVQLAVHIQQFGLLLTKEQIGQLRQLRAAGGNPELDTALATIMGTLKPDALRAGMQLRQIPLPKIPPKTSP